MKKHLGFTLLELLIVIAIIAILAVIVFVALDPLTRFRNARDAQRWSDVIEILDGIVFYQADNGGEYMSAVDLLVEDTYYQIGEAAVGCQDSCTDAATLSACVDLAELVDEGYLPRIPTDPSAGTIDETDYYIYKSATGSITVGACDPEGDSAISVSR